jgi:hypothetical protein
LRALRFFTLSLGGAGQGPGIGCGDCWQGRPHHVPEPQSGQGSASLMLGIDYNRRAWDV